MKNDMIKKDSAAQVNESPSMEGLKMPSFKDMYGDIPRWFKEGVNRYFESRPSENNLTTENRNHVIDADFCRSVIEEFIKKEFGEKILETIPTTPRDRLFSKYNDNGEVEFKGLFRFDEKYFCAKCVMHYAREYLRPKVLTESCETNGGHFVIHYTSGLAEKTLNDIEQELGKYFDKVCEFFSLSDEEKGKLVTDIYIYNEQELFHLCVLGGKGEDWIIGFGGTVPGIHIINPEIIETSFKRFTYESQIHHLSHEFAHAVTMRDGERRPVWIAEGVAEHIVPDDISGIESLQEALKRRPPNKENFSNVLSNDFSTFADSGGYQYAPYMIEYIINAPEYGEEKMREILENPKRSPFDILGVDKEEFRKGWLKYLKKNVIK